MNDEDMDIVESDKRSIARSNEFGLTDKMEAYARNVAKGMTLHDAYVASYDASCMTKGTVYREASKLMDDHRIATRVKTLLDAANERHEVDAARIRRHVMDRLLKESVDMDNPAAARVRSLELLGKIDVVGMFKEHKGEKDGGMDDPDQLREKLRRMLMEITGIKPPIKDS